VRHLRKLLVERYVAKGVELEKAEELAAYAIQVLVSAEAIPPSTVWSWERDAQIYYLCGNRVPVSTIQACYSTSRSGIYVAIRRHGKRKRNAAKA
jgi:hypothetical protein